MSLSVEYLLSGGRRTKANLIAGLGRGGERHYFGRLFEDVALYVLPTTRNQLTVGLDIISRRRQGVEDRYCEFDAPKLARVDVTYEGSVSRVVVKGGDDWT